MESKILDVQRIVKHFNNILAVDHISFTVKQNDFLVIVGPSNSGKTTLLRLLSGLELPDAGAIFLNGVDITLKGPSGRNMAMVTQQYKLISHVSVYDTLAQILRMRQLGKREIKIQVQSALEMLELQKVQAKSLASLSGGELQRVAIARAMVRNVDLYLFDEPITQLDPHTLHHVHQAMSLIPRLKQALGIYATQTPAEAFAVASQIAIMNQGKLQQIDTPDKVLQQPANLFVAQFLSQPLLNQLEGTLAPRDTGYILQTDGFSVPLAASWTPVITSLGSSAQVILGIRPNIIILEWAFKLIDTTNFIVLSAQILHIALLLGKWTLQLHIGQHTQLIAEIKDIHNPNIQPGKVIDIGIDPAHIYLFNAQTEELLYPNET
jgi:multiple sugar transport system ATP-binding protein